jgi:hypothetical protein
MKQKESDGENNLIAGVFMMGILVGGCFVIALYAMSIYLFSH